MDYVRCAQIEVAGEEKGGSKENFKGIEALTRCNKRDGSKTWGLLEYAPLMRAGCIPVELRCLLINLERFVPWASMFKHGL